MSNFKSTQYLTVNTDNHLLSSLRKDSRRSLTPRSSVSFDESSMSLASLEDLRAINSDSRINRENTSSSESSTRSNRYKPNKQRFKSSDALCFGLSRKKMRHRKNQINNDMMIVRPRCYTDPGVKCNNNAIPLFQIPQVDITAATPTTPPSTSPIQKRSQSNGMLNSLLKQTLKVTSTASMGLRTLSAERLAPHTFKGLNEDVKRKFSRSTSSVSTIEQNFPNSTIVATTTPITSLHNHAGTQSVLCLSAFEKDLRIQPVHKPQQSHQHRNKRLFQQQLSTPIEGVITNSPASASGAGDYSSARSLKHNNNSTRLGQLVNVPSEVSLRSISPSRRSASSNSSSTAKHEHSSTAATAATGSSAAAAVSTSSSTTPPEKEKKRKEVSSSRVKKFHRHFSQVSKDEKLINYFSCALVSDILLQGHLYITDKHFAFYSNVFGYVTKVVIPTSSVTKISKEKTAKIIPNAVGVATADERHVFGSFISREAAFRLMCSVCPPLAPAVALLPKDPASIEISEEYSIEDDSSCSVSGNESPAQTNENGCNVNSMAAHKDSSQTLLRHTITNSNLSIVESSAQQRHSDIPLNAKTAVFSASSANLHTHIAGSRISAPIVANLAKTTSNVGGGVGSSASNKNKSSLTFSQPTACTASLTVLPSSSTAEANVTFIAGTASTTTSATSTPTPSTSSSPTTVQAKPSTSIQKALQTLRTFTKTTMLRIRYPRELHVVYMGVMLTLVLTVFTIFLLYRILDIEAKTSIYRLPNEFNWRSGNDDDIFAEALRFQNELEHKSTEEAQNILRANLEQIAKVRRSLETLSMLIHDRGSTFDSHHHYVNRDDTN
ncbi:uncharacterized protein ACN2A1_012390 isoform 2-T2 [Glossina fuscipes fuscipes]